LILVHGLIKWVNLIIATGQNNLAMNRSVLQVAQHYVHGEKLTRGMLNRVEAVIRSYDPCLSCSTHALGQMPLQVQLIDRAGSRGREPKLGNKLLHLLTLSHFRPVKVSLPISQRFQVHEMLLGSLRYFFNAIGPAYPASAVESSRRLPRGQSQNYRDSGIS
jgi:hypothetical protein